MGEFYHSSEAIQRQKASDAFYKAKEQKPEVVSEKEKVKAALDIYIKQYSSTSSVRTMADKKGRDKGYQLDLSADIVDILENIKKKI